MKLILSLLLFTQLTYGDFATNLYRNLNTVENQLISPYNLSQAMAMVYLGAKGETEKQIQTTFNFSHPPKETLTLFGDQQKEWESLPYIQTANALFIQKGYPLLPSYQQTIQETLDAKVETVDFVTQPHAAAEEINEWVEKKTNGKIEDLVSPQSFDPLMRLVVVSTLWFKAPWLHPFPKELTTKAPFHLNSRETQEVDMMHVTDHFRVIQDEEATWVELPFANSDTAFWLIVPKEIEGLQEIADTWSWSDFLSRQKEGRPRQVVLSTPKVTIEREYEMSHLLRKLGMPIAFSHQADLSGISGDNRLHISEVIHKTFFQMDEEGAEAAAATAISIRTTSLDPEPPLKISADRPFLFAISDHKVGALLFTGQFTGK